MTDKFVLYNEDERRHYPAVDGFMPDALSKEKGNLVRFGNDGGVYIDANDILSNQAGNVLGISVIDGRVFYGSSGVGGGSMDITDYVSTDICNLVKVNTTGRLEALAVNMVSADTNNIMTVGSDCKLYVPPPSDVVVPQATTTIFGVVKYDGTTIIKNASDQLVAVGGTAAVVSTNNPALSPADGVINWVLSNPRTVSPAMVQVYENRSDSILLIYPKVYYFADDNNFSIQIDATTDVAAGAYTAKLLYV